MLFVFDSSVAFDVVYNDVTRDSIACSLTLRHVTENRSVKYPVHKIHGDMNQLF